MCNCCKHILVICVLFKIGVEFGVNLQMLYCLGLDEYSYIIFHNKCEFHFMIKTRTKLSG